MTAGKRQVKGRYIFLLAPSRRPAAAAIHGINNKNHPQQQHKSTKCSALLLRTPFE
jgi:hypothetical protein